MESSPNDHQHCATAIGSLTAAEKLTVSGSDPNVTSAAAVSIVTGNCILMALATFSLPPEVILSANAGFLSTDKSRMSLIVSWPSLHPSAPGYRGMSGYSADTSAAAPVTCGVAIDVPPIHIYPALA